MSLKNNTGINGHIATLIESLDDADKEAIIRQYIPDEKELNILSDEESDPVGDEIHSPVKGIVHRYPDRILFKVSNVCDVYCRYCFRRDMIGAGSAHLSDSDLTCAIEYIKSQKQVWEVILSGGDPLVLSTRRLQKIFDALEKIEHVQIIRIHTRVPVLNPPKITDTILSVLKNSSKAVHVVLHVNHVAEISDTVEAKIFELRQNNCSILSQSVLLKGVNDDALALEKLFRKLISIHVKPYYLHHMDRAKGTSHFRVSIKKGQEIMKELQGRLSGICLPKYMLDIPGGYGKIPIENCYINILENGKYHVEDCQGHKHSYEE